MYDTNLLIKQSSCMSGMYTTEIRLKRRLRDEIRYKATKGGVVRISCVFAKPNPLSSVSLGGLPKPVFHYFAILLYIKRYDYMITFLSLFDI